MKHTHTLMASATFAIASHFGAVDLAIAQGKSSAKEQPVPTMKVEWQSSEIQRFIQQRASNPLRSLGLQDESKLSHLKLPVIAFDRPPGIITRAFGVEKRPGRKREIVTDPSNPNWYTIIDTYGDLTVVVEADLRVQQRLPPDTKIYTPSAGLAAAPEVSLMEGKVDEGMEGLIAEYTIYKFPNIPYRVTIECSKKNKQHCADIASIQQDRSALRIISARPPG